jgi:hypothetical protein
MYARFGLHFQAFLKKRMTVPEAEAIVREHLQNREENFLRLIRVGVFGYEKSPYHPLLEHAGVAYADLERMVRDRGLDATLLALRSEGVYYAFEEFKGRMPVVRGNRTWNVSPHDFDNPFLKAAYYGTTGGTTGPGTRIYFDLDQTIARAAGQLLTKRALGIYQVPHAIWRGLLPNIVGVSNLLGGAAIDDIPLKWFTPLGMNDTRSALKNRLATGYIVHAGRFFGAPFPIPEIVRYEDAHIIAEWLARTAKERGRAHLGAFASMSLRVAVAAEKRGIDLSGCSMSMGGEPPTPTKVRAVERVGARPVFTYYFSEVGAIGMGCMNPSEINEHHVMTDALALVPFPRKVPGTDIVVDAFNLTTLIPATSKLLLNVESDDYGIVEKRSCGCPMESYGWDLHVRGIRSFRKLTGEGMTLVGSELETILQETLPARFGGTELDYQLMEEEDEDGFTRLFIIVSPRIAIEDERAVIRTVEEALSRMNAASRSMTATLKMTKSFRVKRMEPVITGAGKLMPLHLGKNLNRTGGHK